MPEDDKKTSVGGLAKKFDEKLVEELYRLAEIIQSNNGHGGAERKSIAADRMAEILNTTARSHPPSPPRNVEHRWVLDVLSDLVKYAEDNELEEIHRLLNDARFKSTQSLNKKH